MASKTTTMLSDTIDLTSPPDSNDLSSDFATTTSPAQKVKAFNAGNVGSAIKNSIQHRQFKTLQKLTHKVIASVKSSAKVIKKKSKKKKQKSTNSQQKKKSKRSPCKKNIHTQTQSCPTTPIATATPVTTELSTATFEIPIVSAMPIQVPVANAFYVKPTPIQRPPSNPHFVAFHEELRALTERIALNPDNTCGGLDPSECDNRCCPYSSGNLLLQRYNLMVRAFQINHLLSTNAHLRKSQDNI